MSTAGLLVLLGWSLDVSRLRDWTGDGIAIKPNTAICMVALGVGLVLLATARPTHTLRRSVAGALGTLVMLIGGLTLIEHLTGRDFGIDMLLFQEAPGARATAAPGRMGPPASTATFLLGTALLLAAIIRPAPDPPPRRFSTRSLVPVLGITVACISLLPITGYIFEVQSLYDVPRFTGIALGTACILLASALGMIFAAPDKEPARTLADSGAAGSIARRAVPVIVLVPLLLEWIRTRGERAGLFGPDLGRLFLILALIGCFSALLGRAVYTIRRGEHVLRATDGRLSLQLEKMQRFHAISEKLEDERQRAEAFNARLAAIVESSDDAIISKDLNGVITSWNAGAARVFGYTESEAIGQPVTMLMPPERSDEEQVILARIRRGERVDHFETIRRRKDGSLLDISLTISPIIDGSGTVVGASKIARDVTVRKRAEQALKESEERFRRLLEERTAALRESLTRLHDAQRLLALGNLAAGIGHDIANMVLPIRARLEPLAQLCVTEESRSDIEAISQSLAHLTNLSAGLRLMALDPSRNQASTEAVDLEQWWDEAGGVMRASLARSMALESSIGPGLGVRMSRHQLTQVVFNLVRNAGEALATKPGGTVHVDAEAAPPFGDGAPRVAVTVRDDGPGLSPDALARCFEPYFSTKGRSIATGMGLAMVRGLVESAGGSVSVASEPGKGATFTIILPGAEPKPRQKSSVPRTTMRTAAISVADARTAALAAMMLEGLEMHTFRHDSSLNHGGPDADLWVTQNAELEAVEGFIARESHRQAVVIGPSARPDGSSEAADARSANGRVSIVPISAPPSTLRDALSAAIATFGEGSDRVAISDSGDS